MEILSIKATEFKSYLELNPSIWAADEKLRELRNVICNKPKSQLSTIGALV